MELTEEEKKLGIKSARGKKLITQNRRATANDDVKSARQSAVELSELDAVASGREEQFNTEQLHTFEDPEEVSSEESVYLDRLDAKRAEEEATGPVRLVSPSISRPLSEKSTKSVALDNLQDSQALVLSEEPFDVNTILYVRSIEDKPRNLAEEFIKKQERDRQAIRSSVSNTWNSDSSSEASTIIEAGTQLERSIDDREFSDYPVEEAVVEELLPDSLVGLELEGPASVVVQQQVLNQRLAKMAAEAFDQNSWGFAGDLAGSLLPGRDISARGSFVDAVDESKLLGENPALTYVNVLKAFNAMPLEDRLAVWPGLLKIIEDSVTLDMTGTVNLTRAEGMVADLLNPTVSEAAKSHYYTIALDAGFSTLDLAGGVAFLKGLFSTAVKIASVSKISKKLANDAAATAVTQGEVISKEVSELQGKTATSAQNNARPEVQSATIAPEAIEGVSNEVAKSINDHLSMIDGKATTFSEEQAFFKDGVTSHVERQFEIKSVEEEMLGLTEDYYLIDGGYLKAADVADKEALVKVAQKRNAKGHFMKREPDKTLVEVEGIVKGKGEVIEEDSGRTVLRFTMIDKQSGETVEYLDKTISWGLDKVRGNYTETVDSYNSSKWWISSPSLWAKASKTAKKIKSDFWDSYVRASHNEELAARTKSELTDMLNSAIGPIKGDKKAMERVNQVLETGDEFVNDVSGVRGKVFTPSELRAGIQTEAQGTVYLTSEAELQAYYGLNHVSKKFWEIQNEVTRRGMIARGMQGVSVDGVENSGKVYDTYGNASSAIDSKNTSLYSAADQEVVSNITKDYLEAQYSRGMRLVKVNTEHEVIDGVQGSVSGEIVDYVLVHMDNISDLPAEVIHRKEGYVPKINEDVNYLLKEVVTVGWKNGKAYTVTKTNHMYASKKQADEAVRRLFQKEVGSTEKYKNATPEDQLLMREKFTRERYEVVADRQLTEGQMLGEEGFASGGLYHGQRSSSDLRFGSNATRPDRVSPMEAYQRQVAHLGNFVTKNEWRAGEQQRWLSTARAMLPNHVIESFNTTRISGDTPQEKALLLLREQINIWSGVPTKEESLWQSAVQQSTELALRTGNSIRASLGRPNKDKIKMFTYLKHKDPFVAAKAAVFHSALGVFNPVQLYVQAQAATVALSRAKDPREMALIINDAFALNILHNVKDPGALKAMAKKFATNENNFEEMSEAYRRSGLVEGIKTNADIQGMESGVGSSLASWKRGLADGGLVFYRAGEKFNRGASFAQAYRDWKRLNPKAKLDHVALSDITLQARQSMLELGRANAARWQGGPDATFLEGVAGTMFQFGQVGAKVLEKSLFIGSEKGLDPGVKMRILAGQGAMFGLAGVPMGNAAFSAMSTWTGTDTSQMDPLTIEAWNGGLTNMLVNGYVGANANVANRATLFAPLNELIRHVMTSGEDLVASKAIPAWGVVTDRVPTAVSGAAQALEILPKLLWQIAVEPSSQDFRYTKEDFLVGLHEIAEVASSGRSLLKYLTMHNMHKVADRYGKTIVFKDFSIAEEAARALGFQSLDEALARDLQFDRMDIEEQSIAVGKEVLEMLHRAVTVSGGNAEETTQAWRNAQVILSQLDERLKPKVRQYIDDALDNPTSLLAREIEAEFDMNKSFYMEHSTRKIGTSAKRNLGKETAIQNIPPVNER